MLRNYLVVAWRNLRKQKLYSLINILGLTVGLSSFLLIFLYLQDEYTYDRMHPESEQTYRLSYWRQWDNGNVEAFAISGGQWGPRLVERFPEAEAVMRMTHSAYPTHVNRVGSVDAFMEPQFYWAEDNFLDFFDLNLLRGEKETVFAQLDNVLISESTAKKYFRRGKSDGSTDGVQSPLWCHYFDCVRRLRGRTEQLPHETNICWQLCATQSADDPDLELGSVH